MIKISEIIQLSSAFSAEVNVGRDYHYKLTEKDNKIDGYLPNASSRSIIKRVLESLTLSTDHKVHLITASYGTGKSYLLLMLGHLLGNNRSVVLEELRRKITDKDSYYKDKLGSTLTNYLDQDDSFLVVIPKYGGMDFDHALLQGLNEALVKQEINYIPATNYRRAADVVDHWKAHSPTNYQSLIAKLINYTPEQFTNLLRATDVSAYNSFKQYFKEIIGADFSESHAEDVYGVFAETARAIKEYGYRGIVILYDEFGDMLSRLVNSPEGSGLPVQDFLEKIKQVNTGTNILFLAASHQDPTSLRDNHQRNVSKVEGRFDRHKLEVTESEAEEIIGTVFLHPNQEAFQELLYREEKYLNSTVQLLLSQGFYKDKDKLWLEEKIIKNLYPLHPLTAYMLPRISSEFAQNTRSMFNFLSPVEQKEGALIRFLESNETHSSNGQLNLFTPDKLFDFFEKNLSEAKSEQVTMWVEAYRTAMGKITGREEVERLFRIILMLTVVRNDRIRPRKNLLFWAMNLPLSQQIDFEYLLSDLVVKEYLELNPTDDVYEFPASGAKSVSKIILEEKQRIANIPLADCVNIWNSIESRKPLDVPDQKERYGVDRYFQVLPVYQTHDIKENITKLKKYYEGSSDEYIGSGLVFHLMVQTENEQILLQNSVKQNEMVIPYIFYAKPKDVMLFEVLQERTLHFKALEESLLRDDIISNAARKQNVTDQFRTSHADLEKAIKDLYQVSQWYWFYGTETTPMEFKSQIRFSEWFEGKVDDLFKEGSVPIVKEDALWFKSREEKFRRSALDEIFSAQKNRIPLDADGNAAHHRIIRNFFGKLKMTVDRERINKTQFGEIKQPEPNTPEAAIFRHFDKTLNSGVPVSLNFLIVPLLQKPYGLSKNLIKFFFVCYVRANLEQIIVSDARRGLNKEKTPSLFEEIFYKAEEFKIRKIEMSGPEKRYLDRLRELFADRTASSFGEVGQQIIGIIKFLTPLRRTLIQQAKEAQLEEFYKMLDEFAISIQRSGANHDQEARNFFLDILPNNLLGISSQVEFEADPDNIEKLIAKLRSFKEYPVVKEREFRLETLSLMAKEVFDGSVIEKDDIKIIVKNWYDKLPEANRSTAVYENTKINDWLKLIRNSPSGKDIISIYLDELPNEPIKDWNDNILSKQADYIQLFKTYRKTVEEYTRDPLEIYRYISLSALAVPPVNCSSESVFASLFKNWWDNLPLLSKKHEFDNTATKILIEFIESTLPTKQKYLEVIPTRWKDNEILSSVVPNKWEDWNEWHLKAIADVYKNCCQEINMWKPPIAENVLFSAIGEVFGVLGCSTADNVKQEIKDKWYQNLPERTRNTNWKDITTAEALLLTNLDNGDFYVFLSQKLPQCFELPQLKKWDQDILNSYLQKLEILKTNIECYRRPLTEVISAIEKKKSTSVLEYQNSFYHKIRHTEAFKNHVEKDTNLLNALLPKLIIKYVRANSPISDLISEAANVIDIPQEHHAWTKEQQILFVNKFWEAINSILDWKFPEDKLMQDAKKQLTKQIQETCQNFKLSPSQLHKLLNDVLAESTINVTA